MKRTIAIILMITALNLLAFARPVKRIVFKKGATKAVIYGKLNSYKDSQGYVIKVRAGQVIRVDTESLEDGFTTVGIGSPTGEGFFQSDLGCHSHAETTAEWSDRENGSNATVAGDYTITVGECGKGDEWKGKFKLTVEVVEAVSK